YRFFERVPALVSYGAIILLVVLSIFSPILAAVYLLVIIITMLVKVVGITYHMVAGRMKMDRAATVDWSSRLGDLEDPRASYDTKHGTTSGQVGHEQHIENLRLIAAAEAGFFPKPSDIYNAL